MKNTNIIIQTLLLTFFILATQSALAGFKDTPDKETLFLAVRRVGPIDLNHQLKNVIGSIERQIKENDAAILKIKDPKIQCDIECAHQYFQESLESLNVIKAKIESAASSINKFSLQQTKACDALRDAHSKLGGQARRGRRS